MKTLKLVLLAILFSALGMVLCEAKAQSLKPLEAWGIKTADYKKAAKYWADDDEYKDVPPPNCAKAVKPKDMKILCSREDFQKLAWFTRRFSIYAEENATKVPLDHQKAYAEQYHSKCTNEDCLGKELKRDFYQSLDDSGMAYILEDEAN